MELFASKVEHILTTCLSRLLVSAVAAHFPGTTTLKYNGPTGAERAVGVSKKIC